MASPECYGVLVMMNFIGSPLTRALGYAPGWTGIGEDVPKEGFLQWTGWINSPRYMFDDTKLAALGNFARYTGAMRALCISDDPSATRPPVELMCTGFTAAKPEIITVTPADVGVGKIGHFGFFRPDHRDTLWRGPPGRR